jgi:hypothetical protein
MVQIDKRGVPVDINYDKGALVIKMNTPTIILPDQFRVVFDMLGDTVSFIRPGAPYDTTDKYYKSILKFGSNSQTVYSENVKHDDKSLYTVLNDLTNPRQLTTENIKHNTDYHNATLSNWLNSMQNSYQRYTRKNGDTVWTRSWLDYFDDTITKLKLIFGNLTYPDQPTVIRDSTTPAEQCI